MTLSEAWTVLGWDHQALMEDFLRLDSRLERVAAAEKALEKAKARAKAACAALHPDRNPGNAEAERLFRRIQEAVRTVESHTEELRKSSDEVDRRKTEGRVGFIEKKTT